MVAPALSVIVPVAPGEAEWRGLLKQLYALPAGTEVILACADSDRRQIQNDRPARFAFKRCKSPVGRAGQMNCGAHVARGRWLWFLHADTSLLPDSIPALVRFIEEDEPGLGFFDLAFRSDGPRLVQLNAIGANLRSRWLGLPFGDQGLLLPRLWFQRLGGYDEQAQYGEDHLLVWKARAAGLKPLPVGATILTSARKYAQRGWLRTTLRHWRLTIAQAWPEWRRQHQRSGT